MLILLLISGHGRGAGGDHTVSTDESLSANTEWDNVWIEDGATLWTDDYTLTVASMTVNGSLICNDTTKVDVGGSMTIAATGRILAPSGELECSGNIDNSGDFDHNDGLFELSSGAAAYEIAGSFTSDNAFYNLAVENKQLNMDVDIDVHHDLSGGYFVKFTGTGKTLTLGTDSYASQVSITNIGATNGLDELTIAGASADYPAEIPGFLYLWGTSSLSGDNLYLKWVDVQDDVTASVGADKKTTLTGTCTFQDFSVGASYVLDINGQHGTFEVLDGSGTLDADGHLVINEEFDYSGLTLSNSADCVVQYEDSTNKVLGGTWEGIYLNDSATGDTVTAGLSVDFLVVNSSLEVTAPTLNMTASGQGINGTGYLNLTGSYGSLVNVSGTDWTIDPDYLADYYFIYAVFNHGNNTGSKTIVALGAGHVLSGSWDFSAPAITPHYISEGLEHEISNTSLVIDFTALDMTFLHSLNYTVYDSDGSLVTRGNLSLIANETATHRWNVTLDITGWAPGDYVIYYYANDTHNPVKSKVGRGRARNMGCLAAGEMVGHKTGKDKSGEVNASRLDFYTMEPVVTGQFRVEFTNVDECRQEVIWTDEDNFKLVHTVRLKDKDKEVTGARVRISAPDVVYLPNSEYVGHFLLNHAYFYDFQDFADQGGSLFVEDSGVLKGGWEYYDLLLTHPGMKKNQWFTIDPLSGAVNEATAIYNFTISQSGISSGRSPGDGDGALPLCGAVLIGAVFLAVIAIALPGDRVRLTG